jgi:copper(I)-binding protein
MRHTSFLLSLALSFGSLSLAACGGPDSAEQMRANFGVRGATLRLNPNPAAPSAAYFTLAAGHEARILTGASSVDVERIEMHENMQSGGMASMSPIDRLTVPADGEVVFAPGGKHLMLFGIKPAALAAGRLTIDLTFGDGSTLPVAYAFDPGTSPSSGPASGNAAAMDHSAH